MGKIVSKRKINVYTCQSCSRRIVTIDRIEGTTPFMIACEESEGGCNGTMYSSLYNVDQSLEPTHEWYRPDSVDHYPEEHREMMRDHIANGGLDIRPIKKQQKKPEKDNPTLPKFWPKNKFQHVKSEDKAWDKGCQHGWKKASEAIHESLIQNPEEAIEWLKQVQGYQKCSCGPDQGGPCVSCMEAKYNL